MSDERSRPEPWGLFFLYPLAALLVFLGGQGGAAPDYFGRDWPHIVGGPAGVFVWWIVADAGRSWPTLAGGYLAGVAVSFVCVVVLRAIARRFRRTFERQEFV
jgi:hypothetical protein